jgi:single-stranded-DNA-specific exonuclease
VRHAGELRDAIWFQRTEPLPQSVQLAFRIQLDEWNGRQRVQMVVEAAQPDGPAASAPAAGVARQ